MHIVFETVQVVIFKWIFVIKKSVKDIIFFILINKIYNI